MKTYEVIIDYECLHLEIKAKTQEEAEVKGFEKAQAMNEIPKFWVGDCEEIKE